MSLLKNTGKLAGRTLFITGASRGIGKAIALKAARDGANVVIAAKTAEAHPKLPGTIYTAAKEIEELGGKALPCIVDVRDEDQVRSAVSKAVETFGGIDILVNNASAISLTGTEQTSMKKYDLMNQVNARGTYLCSQVCIPHLKQGTNPHILNISPPLNMKSMWFRGHVAYTMAKYGMSMCVLGMADEFKDDGVAVNALWPRTVVWTAASQFLGGGDESRQAGCRTVDIMADAAYLILTQDSTEFTGNFCIDDAILSAIGITDFSPYSIVKAIYTAAMEMLGGGESVAAECRKVDIMSDAAYAIFRKDSKTYTGKFLIDDDVLKEEGMTDLDGYACVPGATLMPDFFLDPEDPVTQTPKWDGAAPGAAQTEPTGPVAQTFNQIKPLLSEELVKGTGGVFLFNLAGDVKEQWFLDLKNGAGSLGQGEAPQGKADCTMTMSTDDFVKMFSGKLKPTSAFMTGKLKISGNMALAMKLEKLMASMKKAKL